MSHSSSSAVQPFCGYRREVVDRAWRFAQPIPGNDPELWRKDEHGAWMHRLAYGDRASSYGWKIDDLSARGAASGSRPPRPIQWQNYLDRFEPPSRSRITADGLRNSRGSL